MAFSVSYVYTIIDQYSGKLAKIRKQTDKYKKSASRASKSAKKFGKDLREVSQSADGLIGTMVTGAAVIFPVSKAVAFESQMANVKKVINKITPKEFADLTEVIKSSAEQLGRLPVAVGQIAEQAGKTGVPVNEMAKFIELVAKTAISFDLVDEVAGTNLGQLRTRLKLSVEGVEELMDSVNFMADNTSASGDRMIEIISRLSGEFLNIKMPTQFIAGWAAFADQVEVTPQLAASGLRQLVQQMEKRGMGEALLKDPSGAIRSFLGKFEKIKPGKRGQVLQKVLGMEAAKFAKKAISQLDLLDSTLKKATGAEQFGSMTRELVTKTSTAAFKLAQMNAAVNNLAIDIGGPMLDVIKQLAPPIIRLANKIRDFVNLHPKMARMMLLVIGMAAAIVPLTLILGTLATVVGALLTPIGATVAGIILFIGLVGTLSVGNSELRNSLVNLGKSLWPLLEPFAMLFEMLGGGQGIGNILAAVFNGIANALTFILSPLKAVIELGKGLASGDLWGGIKGAVGALGAGGAAVMPDFSGFNNSPNSGMRDNRLASGSSRAVQSTLNGRIDIEASGGAKVKKAEMYSMHGGNLGFNMAGG